MTIQTFRAIEELVNNYSEIEMENWGYDGICGFVTIQGNPYESQIWSILPELQYVDNITKLELNLAEDMDDDYDILNIEFIEIRPKKTLKEYKAILNME